MGWFIVAFDLPVGTKEQRKTATDFRNFLLDDGNHSFNRSRNICRVPSAAMAGKTISRLLRFQHGAGSQRRLPEVHPRTLKPAERIHASSARRKNV